MKTKIELGLALGLAGLLAIGVYPSTADVRFSAGLEISSQADFYAPLSPYGSWVTVSSYGRCWRPAGVAVSWRPYCEGNWEWTDCGWYWASDDPWAWACYHYGNWVFDPGYGYVWVPGTEWAPAWVVWRESPEYIGWAPCGPGGVVVASSPFVFVDIHHFGDPIRPDGVIVNNTLIVNRTHVVNSISRTTLSFGGTRSQVVVNRGPSIDLIQRAEGRTLTQHPIHEVVGRTPAPAAVPRARSGIVMDRPVLPEPHAWAGTHQDAPAMTQHGQNAPGHEREIQRTAPPPTGPNKLRTYHEVPAPRSVPVPERATPQPPPREIQPVEPRMVPPTGREVPRAYAPPQAPAPNHGQFTPLPKVTPPVAPARPAPPPGEEHHKDRDQ